MSVRAHVFVSGIVQGVFFRASTRDEATKHGVTGWVRNTFDNRVEAVFEGKHEDVEKVIDFCRRGPPSAVVKNMDVKWQDYVGEFNGFSVRRTVNC
ncbi:MAG: acylphosphatase [Candidatus Bathyarchaeia archaeon]|jgi:acylphosphatase